MSTSESVVVRAKHPCDHCGSSDAAHTYDDGHIYCFSCGRHTPGNGEVSDFEEAVPHAAGLIDHEARDIKNRGIKLGTAQRYGYGIGRLHGTVVQVANYRCNRELVSQHTRTKNKEFAWLNYTQELELFGQHLYERGGKHLIVTEGEIDCLTWAQTRELRWPVVAVPGIGSIKLIKRNLQWINSFEEVVLYMDMDEPGQKFAIEIARLIAPGKCRIASTAPYKDANELFLNEGQAALYGTLWQATSYTPDALLSFADALASAGTEDRFINTGIAAVDELVQGLALGELLMIGAGSNIGKSLLLKHIAHAMAAHTPVAYFPLEEGAAAVAQSMVCIPGNFNRENVTFFKDTGVPLTESIPETIEYLASAYDTKVFCIDHVTSVFNQMESDVKTIDKFMQTIQSLAQRLEILVFYNSHVRDPQTGSYENGAMPSTNSFRGSGMLYRIPDVVLGLSRNIMDDHEKYFTTIKCLKHRAQGMLVGHTRVFSLTDGVIQITEGIDDDNTGRGDDF